MKKTCIILCLLFLIFPGCAKEEVKPSADSLLTTEAIDTINALRKAYQEKNGSLLRDRSGPLVAEYITGELSFDEVALAITPRIVKIKASTVVVNTSWHGEWVIQAKTVKNRGIADLVLEGSPMKLIRIDGDNPFRTPLIK
jgi:hypothetical protein